MIRVLFQKPRMPQPKSFNVAPIVDVDTDAHSQVIDQVCACRVASTWNIAISLKRTYLVINNESLLAAIVYIL